MSFRYSGCQPTRILKKIHIWVTCQSSNPVFKCDVMLFHQNRIIRRDMAI